MKWTDKKVKEFLDWQQLSIYGPKIKLKHRLDSRFLIFLWKDYISGGNIASFFLSELYKADANDITLDITGERYVHLSDAIKCAGYFDSGTKTLASSTGHQKLSNWLATLVHETCHMDQYLENPKLWEEYDKSASIDDWLAGKNFSKKRIHSSIDVTQELELDCEIRSVKKIEKFGLPLDLDEYVRKTNAYVFFYQYLKESRTWPVPPKSPYGDKIWPAMPNYILSKNEYLTLPDEYRKLYEKHL